MKNTKLGSLQTMLHSPQLRDVAEAFFWIRFHTDDVASAAAAINSGLDSLKIGFHALVKKQNAKFLGSEIKNASRLRRPVLRNSLSIVAQVLFHISDGMRLNDLQGWSTEHIASRPDKEALTKELRFLLQDPEAEIETFGFSIVKEIREGPRMGYGSAFARATLNLTNRVPELLAFVELVRLGESPNDIRAPLKHAMAVKLLLEEMRERMILQAFLSILSKDSPRVLLLKLSSCIPNESQLEIEGLLKEYEQDSERASDEALSESEIDSFLSDDY